MSYSEPKQEWTDRERSRLASYVLKSAISLEQPTTDSRAELLEIIHAAHAVLTVPEEELKAMHAQIDKYADRLNPP